MSRPAGDVDLGMSHLEAERVARAVAERLPPALIPLFSPQFTRSHVLFDEFVHRLTLRVARETKLPAALAAGGTAEEIVHRSGFEPRRALVPVDWMLRHLASRGVLARDDRDGLPRFRADGALPALDPSVVVAEQRRHDPACLPSYTLAETAARDYPAFLRGERSGDEILLAPARLPLWVSYFSNDNALYAVNNRVGGVALEAWLPRGGHDILEIGGGLGSGTAAALERLAAVDRLGEITSYRFTELVSAFLRRGQRLLQERYAATSFLTFAPLDMNRSFAEQEMSPACVSVVYAVNTLHVAHDLTFTLAEVHRVLRPGGQLIVAEGVRPLPGQTCYPEFIFNLMETFRAPRLHPVHRPNGGFLMPEQWRAALEAAGFVDVRILPDIARIRDVFPTFYVAALGATRAS